MIKYKQCAKPSSKIRNIPLKMSFLDFLVNKDLTGCTTCEVVFRIFHSFVETAET